MISWDTRKGAIKESIVTEMFESFTETIRILGIKHSEESIGNYSVKCE